MKKICFIMCAVLMSIGVQAAEQSTAIDSTAWLIRSPRTAPHSIAFTFGSGDGISYRYFIDEQWAIQTNIMWKYLSTYGTKVSYLSKDVNGTLECSRTSQWGKLYAWTAEVNPNFIYQSTIHDWKKCSLYWNSGAGMSVGMAQDYQMPNDYPLWGKFGITTISGFELAFSKVPLSIFTESFAGYGLLWNSYEHSLYGITSLAYSTNHFIDWGSDIGLRVRF